MAKKKSLKKVVIGGTFDILHRGHEALLRRAFSLGETTIGLTSNKMAEKIKRRRVGNFQRRKKELEKFIKKGLPGEEDKSSSSPLSAARVGKYKIKKIEDKFGPTLKEDFDYIVVSPETYKTALLINKKRREIKKKPIKIVKIKFVLGENGKPISATQIIKGKIDKQGKLITESRLRDEGEEECEENVSSFVS
jgi:pantetheine-phosphate adenylyltransferase